MELNRSVCAVTAIAVGLAVSAPRGRSGASSEVPDEAAEAPREPCRLTVVRRDTVLIREEQDSSEEQAPRYGVRERIVYEYDAEGRIVRKEEHTDGSSEPRPPDDDPEVVVTGEYGEDGTLVERIEVNHILSYTAEGVGATFEYGSDGELVRKTRFSYRWRQWSEGRVTTDWSETQYAYDYDENGRLVRKKRAGSDAGSFEYEYDEAGRVVRAVRDDEKRAEFQFRYDDKGRLTRKIGPPEGSDEGPRWGWTYEYDGRDRLVRKVRDGHEQMTSSAPGGGLGGYRPTSTSFPADGDADRIVTYEYDDDGHRREKRVDSYHMPRYEPPDGDPDYRTTYEYDRRGRLARKTRFTLEAHPRRDGEERDEWLYSYEHCEGVSSYPKDIEPDLPDLPWVHSLP